MRVELSAQTQTRRKTVRDLAKAKGGQPLVCLTAYDAPRAALLDPFVDLLLVGDSVGMVVHGLDSTVGVTVDMMILHGQAVMRGSSQAFVVVDMPFGSYEASPEIAFANASRIMMETRCQAVKLESGVYAGATVKYLVDRGIPVIGHVGLRPQAINVDGGFKAKGRTQAERQRVLDEAKAVQDGGAFAIVIEGVAEDLALEITQKLAIPTIGIGASAACDGQILVTEDMLGLFDWTPKFVRRYGNVRAEIIRAVEGYAGEVRSRAFPAVAETYSIKTEGSNVISRVAGQLSNG